MENILDKIKTVENLEGNLMEKFCCVNNNDIINNQNYPYTA